MKALAAVVDARLWRFLAVGVVNTAVGLTTIFAAKAMLGLDDVLANAAGYGLGLSVSFVLNKSWTFTFTGDTRAALLRFMAVFAVAYACNLATVLLLLRITSIDDYVVHVLAIAPYTTVFYLGSRHFAFKSRGGAGPVGTPP